MSIQSWTKDSGAHVTVEWAGPCAERYTYDAALSPKDGWRQWDTSQDASYFGVWVNAKLRKTVTFAEGDVTIVTCPTAEAFKAELAAFYGPPPVALTIITKDNTLEKYVYNRLGPEDVE